MSNQLNLLRRGSSEVINGNMLTLPVGGGMLYVQPVYVQSSGDAKYPRLQRVLVSFGDKVGFAPTLEEALNQVFGGSSGAKLDSSAASPRRLVLRVLRVLRAPWILRPEVLRLRSLRS